MCLLSALLLLLPKITNRRSRKKTKRNFFFFDSFSSPCLFCLENYYKKLSLCCTFCLSVIWLFLLCRLLSPPPRFAVVIIIIILKTERRQKEEEKEDDSILKAYVKKEEDARDLRDERGRDAKNDDDDIEEESCYYYFSDKTLLGMSASFSTKKLAKLANEKREKYFGNVVTFSPKVFVPLTFACRDKCGYCTFVKEPEEEEKKEEHFHDGRGSAERGERREENGATECLFTLGDRPEAKYPAAKRELEEKLGCASTVEYVAKCAKRVLEETGLLPHVNCGVLTVEELKLLKKYPRVKD